ncbi:MAG: hypothetical protein RLZZ416_412 [Candidatus Parcubacteria bacterium]|jgi:predicted nucleic acid-binding protein
MENRPRVFVDSSVLIAALLSADGGSAYALREKHSGFVLLINEYVLEEVRDVLDGKLQRFAHLSATLFLLIGFAGIRVLPNPSKRDVAKLFRHISKKDAPILASALRNAEYLLTLDNEFFSEKIIRIANQKGLKIVKPGDLIRLAEMDL